MTEGEDSRETVAMSTNDDGEARRAQHQRALLHNAPQAPPREPNPGELLMKFGHGQDVFRVELRDFQPNGVETQIFQNGELLTACRFTVRALARRLGRAEARRDSQRGRPVNDLPDDQKVRRCMSFSRFVWLLQSSSCGWPVWTSSVTRG